MPSIPRDDNRSVAIAGVSSVDNATPTAVRVNPTTKRALVDSLVATDSLGSSSGTLTPLFVDLDVSANGDNVAIAAVGGKIIRVINGLLIASAAVTIKFTDGLAGTSVSGRCAVIANGGFQIPYAPTGNFQTSVSNALVLNLSGAVQVGGWLSYITV